jgi:putative transposase
MPTSFLMVLFAGWMNRQQQAVIDYLKAENEILKSQLNGRRPRLTDEERRRLAEKGRALGRKLLAEVACIVTPDTILAWHRRLVALKWTFARGRVGRPPIADEVRVLILEMANNDSNWGYTSIRDRLQNLGHHVSRATVANVLREHGVETAPRRGGRTSWFTFLKSALVRAGGHRLHDGRGLDQGWLGDALRFVRDGAGDTKGDVCRHHAVSTVGSELQGVGCILHLVCAVKRLM